MAGVAKTRRPRRSFDSEWLKDARCAQPEYLHVDFFPDRGESLEPARTVCADCPVTAACLADALADTFDDDCGVRAGMSRMERDRMRKARR